MYLAAIRRRARDGAERAGEADACDVLAREHEELQRRGSPHVGDDAQDATTR
jgi:hypothetical protein